MYKGNNPTAIRSKEWILDAFYELLKTTNYENITVKEICKKADLSRQTFYQLFDSKEELITLKCEEFFEGYKHEIERRNVLPQDLEQIVHIFYEYVKEKEAFIRILIDNKFSYVISDKWNDFLQRIEQLRFSELTNVENQYLFYFISGAISQVLLKWFQNDMDLSIDEISRLTLNLIYGKFFEVPKDV